MAKRTKRRNDRYSHKRNSRKKRVSKRRRRVSRRRVSKKTYKHKNMRGGMEGRNAGMTDEEAAIRAPQGEADARVIPISGSEIIYRILKEANLLEYYRRIVGEEYDDSMIEDSEFLDALRVSLRDIVPSGKGGHRTKIIYAFNRYNKEKARAEGGPSPRPAPVSGSGASFQPATVAQPEPEVVRPKLVKRFVEDKTIHPYQELFDESGKTMEIIGGILCHGSQQKVSNIDELTFTITPVDLYLMTSDEVDLLDDATRAALNNEWNYFRKYTAGSLIQNYDLNFYTSSDPDNYTRDDVQGSFAFGGLLHFSEGVDTEQLIEYLIFRDDMLDDREMFSRHEDIYFHKDLLKNKVDDPNFNGEIMYKLSDIFNYIEAAKRKGEVVPDKWIGRFCRGAAAGDEVPWPLNISFFEYCGNSELGNLPEDFFKGKVDLSDRLLRLSSFSTSNMLQNFTGIFNDIMEYVSSGNTIPDTIEKYIISNYDMNLQGFLKIMKSTIEGFRPLNYKDICVILLMYNILTS